MKKFLKVKLILFLLWFIMFAFSFIVNDLKQINFPEWNIIFVLDVSNSMNVEDVFYNGHSINRLELAKKIIENNVDKVKRPFWIIVFSDKFNYLIPPTLDTQTLKTYLRTINTNILDGWTMHFVKSFKNMQKVLNPSDTLVVISDFDTDEDLTKVQLRNYSYAIWVWTKSWEIVKNKNDDTLYKNWQILKSSFREDKLKSFPSNEYKILYSYTKWEVLDFIKNFKNKNLINKKNNINYTDIFSFILITMSL